jgi:hypothetical protein
MKVIVVAPPRPDLAEPFSVAFLILAHLNFGAWKNKDPGGTFILCGLFHDAVMHAAPAGVHVCAAIPT